MSRLDKLLQFLSGDPQNRALLIDAAKAALDESKASIALDLLARAATIAPLEDDVAGLQGLAAMRSGEFAQAAAIYSNLRQNHPEDPAIRFNFAWSLAMGRRFDEALEQLDTATIGALAQAAMLKIQVLHELGRVDEAMVFALAALQNYPAHVGLNAAISVLAIDCEDLALAEKCALAAGDHPDALTTRATLALDRDQGQTARKLFEEALVANSGSARAWVGLGLTKLAGGAALDAARDLERGAGLFGDHIGSWIAAGWAHLVAGERPAARKAFERALAIDPAFSESQGSLAVLSVLEGDLAQAKRYCETALRLDRQSYSGALARALLAAGEGDEERARAIVEKALSTPIDDSGRTIAQMLAKRGLSR